VKAFKLIDEPFTIDNGMLTPKMSQKRPIIAKAYSDVIAALYEA